MILDVISYLKSDATLDTLLGATGSDSKIYPNQAKDTATVPYIIYRLTGDGTLEENLLELTATFECVATTYISVRNIRDQLLVLLDRQDTIKNVVTSASYYIYWSKNVTGEDVKEPVQDHFHKLLTFNFKYAKI